MDMEKELARSIDALERLRDLYAGALENCDGKLYRAINRIVRTLDAGMDVIMDHLDREGYYQEDEKNNTPA